MRIWCIACLSEQLHKLTRCRPLAQDGEADVETYNRELDTLAEQDKHTWFKCPWLYAE